MIKIIIIIVLFSAKQSVMRTKLLEISEKLAQTMNKLK